MEKFGKKKLPEKDSGFVSGLPGTPGEFQKKPATVENIVKGAIQRKKNKFYERTQEEIDRAQAGMRRMLGKKDD